MEHTDDFSKYTDTYKDDKQYPDIGFTGQEYSEIWNKYLETDKKESPQKEEEETVAKEEIEKKENKKERIIKTSNQEFVVEERETDEDKESKERTQKIIDSIPEDYFEKAQLDITEEEKEEGKKYIKFLKEQKQREQSQQYKEQMEMMKKCFTPEVEVTFASYMLAKGMFSKEQFTNYLEAKGIRIK